ncbi:MAG: C25 family cysteine peptidase [Armatimonadota bacterium]|nr:C25 family cysteine peptidase [bacterium]
MVHRMLSAAIAVLFLCTSAALGLASSIDIKLDIPSMPVPASDDNAVNTAVAGRKHIKNLSANGFTTCTEPGNPALPCKLIYVALPPDADEASIQIDSSEIPTTTLDGAYDIEPSPPPATSQDVRDWGRSKAITAGRNRLVYEKNDFYPSQHLRVRDVGRLRTWKIATVEYWPYTYNPVTGKLHAVNVDHVSITYSASSQFHASADPAAASMAAFVSNIAQAEEFYQIQATSATTADYVIITTAAIASSSTKLTQFRDFLASRGYTPQIITESEWGGGTGDVAANCIRSWLAANYLSLGIKYVLLIGNPDPVWGDVPMKMLWPRYYQSTYREAPSDYFYCDLTGNWDRNGDGNYGVEPDDFGTGGIDRIPDVYVGRIPYYGSISDLDHILQKTIDYESGQLGSWSRTCLLPMKPMDTSTPSYQLGEQIKNNIATPSGLSSVRIYESGYFLTPPPESNPCNYELVASQWQSGAGIVAWMTHGASTYAVDVFSASMCSDLDDTKPSVLFAGSCNNGTPEVIGNLAYSLLLHGAISTVAASRVSWYYPSEITFTNSDSIGGYAYQYCKYILLGEESCGRALMNMRLNAGTKLWCNQLVFNLYGDPSLAYNTSAFGAIAGRVLSASGSPISGATVKTSDSKRISVTRPSGAYYVSGFKANSLDLDISAPGYYPQHFHGLPITIDQATPMDFLLQPAANGSIIGHVYDSLGSPIPSASVSTVDGNATTYTLADGSYNLGSFITGVYSVSATKSPYAAKTIYNCQVCAGGATSVDFWLQSNTGSAVVNGGFEGLFNNNVGASWSLYRSTSYSATAAAATDYYKYGMCSQQIRMPQPSAAAYAGIRQVVQVSPNTRYTLTAWQRDRFTGQESTSSDNIVSSLGYDLNGGTDPASATVVWQDFTAGHNTWHYLTKSITTTGASLTIFLRAKRKLASGGDDCCVWFDGISLDGPLEAPAVPIVKVYSRYQTDNNSIHATWSCSSSDVAGYQCAVSSTPDPSGIIPGCGWISTGTDTSITRTGFGLNNGSIVRVLIRVTNRIGVTSEIGASEPVRIVQTCPNLAQAKLLADGTWVRITGLKCSTMGEGPECFVEDSNRASGIKTTGEWAFLPYLQQGTTTDLFGCMASQGDMRIISNAEFMPSLTGAPIRPIGMPNKHVGGSSLVCPNRTPAVAQEGSPWSTGPNNVGMLVSVWGRVTWSGSNSFTITDGSLPYGLTIECHNSTTPPSATHYVKVTGISTPHGVTVYNQSDIVTLQ